MPFLYHRRRGTLILDGDKDRNPEVERKTKNIRNQLAGEVRKIKSISKSGSGAQGMYTKVNGLIWKLFLQDRCKPIETLDSTQRYV